MEEAQNDERYKVWVQKSMTKREDKTLLHKVHHASSTFVVGVASIFCWLLLLPLPLVLLWLLLLILLLLLLVLLPMCCFCGNDATPSTIDAAVVTSNVAGAVAAVIGVK
jgi:hypothetical protein